MGFCSSKSLRRISSYARGCREGAYHYHAILPAFFPFACNNSRLTTVRPSSCLAPLYGQITEYQLENTEARVRYMLEMVREDLTAGRVDVKAIKQVLSFVTQKLAQLDKEIA
jgi:hypothetical protein